MKSRTSAGGASSRRQFTKTVAAALLAAPLVPSLTNGQTPPGSREPPAPPNPQPTPSPQQPPKPSPLAEAYAGVARVRFGDRLTPEQLERLKRELEGNVRTADRLRAYKLKNGDEPDFVFSV